MFYAETSKMLAKHELKPLGVIHHYFVISLDNGSASSCWKHLLAGLSIHS